MIKLMLVYLFFVGVMVGALLLEHSGMSVDMYTRKDGQIILIHPKQLVGTQGLYIAY